MILAIRSDWFREEEAEEELIRDRDPELEAVEAFLPEALTETNPSSF